MTSMNNYHVTICNDVSKPDESITSKVKHFCFLFAGKLNFFGSDLWERYALEYYKSAAEFAKNNNIKITFKFLIYEVDEMLPGNYTTLLSGFGNIYELLFDNIKNSRDVEQCRFNNNNSNDFIKYKAINLWADFYDFGSCKIKKYYFEDYCKAVFNFADSLEFYYVNSNYTLKQVKDVLKNNDIKSLYAHGQHYQVNNAYENYPDIFADCDDNTLIFKVRYDGYNNPVTASLKSFANAFYSINNDATVLSTTPYGLAFDFYSLPTVMYSRSHPLNNIQIHHLPNDISMIFNSAGIKTYAKNYTDWLLNKTIETYNPENDTSKINHFVGLNIHASLGKFFLENGFSTIDYTPQLKPGQIVHKFGSPLRELSDSNNLLYSDALDDYKLRWYQGHDKIKEIIIEKFGKNDNT